MRFTRHLALGVLGLSLLAVGCAHTHHRTIDSATPEGVQHVSIAYPTGQRSTSVVLLEKWLPYKIRAGQSYSYKIKVTNLTALTLPGVAVTEEFPASFGNPQSEPAFQSDSEGKAFWHLGDLEPRESRTITITGTPTGTDALPCCTAVRYDDPQLCAETSIYKPELKVGLNVLPQALVCDTVPVVYTVTNTGTGKVRDVVLQSTLSAGLITKAGDSDVTIKVGHLAEGQTKEYTVKAYSEEPGNYTVDASASGDKGRTVADTQSASTVLSQPVLAINSAGSDRQYVGRKATFKVRVQNTGSAAAENAVVTSTIPSGTRFVSASGDGVQRGSKVVWPLGSFAKGADASFSFTVKGTEAGLVTSTSTISGDCATRASSSATAEFVGVPAILLEVVDLNDPIEVGETTTYEITVTNQGSAPDTNIQVVATLEEMAFVSVDGATGASAEGNQVTFAPVTSLDAKKQVSWKLTTKALKAGDIRFKVQMNSDELKRPVEETEATNVY